MTTGEGGAVIVLGIHHIFKMLGVRMVGLAIVLIKTFIIHVFCQDTRCSG